MLALTEECVAAAHGTPPLDEKGRLAIPAKFRGRFKEGAVVTRWTGECLAVWPTPEWTALNADMLFTQDLIVSPPLSLALSGQTAANLYAFTINGTAVTADMFNQYFDSTLYTPANSTFLVGVQQGTELGRNIKMLQAFQISASSSATKVTLTNDSTKLAYSANLHNLTITGMPAGTPALMLDWGQMHTNAMGAPFDATAITSAVVGHYTQSASELESKFLDLDTLATNYYRVNIDSGSVLDFTMLKDDKSGASFPGITSDGTWLVGLICGNCRNPAPWYMTILKPCTM